MEVMVNVLDGTELGQDIVRLTREFDANVALRTRLLRYALATGIEPLDEDELELAQLNAPLNKRSSPVPFRQIAFFHLFLIEGVLEEIHHEEVPRILTPENLLRCIGVLPLWYQWESSRELRDAVEHLQSVLTKAVFWFNVQLVCGLVQLAIEHWDFDTRESYLPNLDFDPDREVVLHPASMVRLLTVVDREAYDRGAGILSRSYMPACEAVAGCGDYAWKFLLTREQLIEGAAELMGVRTARTSAGGENDERLRRQANPSAFTTRPGGTILVPASLVEE